MEKSPLRNARLRAMDATHDRLLEAMSHAVAVPDAQFARAYSAVIASVERDFRDEELIMEALGFPGLRKHREEHARVLGGLHHADPFVQKGDIARGRHALALLPQWFSAHLLGMDSELAAAVERSDGAGAE